jgi:hypothetical protein
LVETKDGLRPIEELQVGDLVLSRDTDTGETAFKAITDLIPRHDRVIWEVSLYGADGETELFETTDDHPWWIAGIGWKTTEELSPNMSVVTADGRGMVIASIIQTKRNDATYNITVADFETYFVGKQQVLVHNCNLRMKGNGDARRVAGTDQEVKSTVAQIDNVEDLKCAQCKLKDSIKNRRDENKRNDRNSSETRRHNDRIKLEEKELRKVEEKIRDKE